MNLCKLKYDNHFKKNLKESNKILIYLIAESINLQNNHKNKTAAYAEQLQFVILLSKFSHTYCILLMQLLINVCHLPI